MKYKVLTPKRIAWNCHFPILEVLRQHSNFWHPEPLSWCCMRGEAEQPPACCLGMFPYRRATVRENSLSLTSSTDDLTSPLVASCWLLLVSGTTLQAGSCRWRAKRIWPVKRKLHETDPYTFPKYEMLQRRIHLLPPDNGSLINSKYLEVCMEEEFHVHL